ncbi:MAG TPA: DUF3857 and transglutaminase domain-containing protein, partial [Terriglobales bacterium]
MSSRRFFLLPLLLVSTVLAQVPAPNSVPTPPVNPAEPTVVLDHSQEAYVVEKLHTSYRFENDGTGRREFYVKIKVQSEAGVEQWGQVVVGYNSANERVEIPFVRVLKLDGSTVTAPQDSIQDLSIPLERDAPVYTDYRQKHITVPGLRPGEELEYGFITITQTPLAPGQFWMEHDFAKNGTVLDEQLALDVPKDRTIKLKTKPGNDAKIAESNGRRVYTWASSHVDKDESEKKKDKQKQKHAAKEPEVPAVQMTTFASWEQMGRWYASLEKDRREPSAEIRAKAAELTKGKTTDLEKIQALYDFVGPNFRYISLSFGVGRFQPHAAEDVLDKGYGDCKDKHTLLAALLKAAGYDAWPVLIHTRRKLDAEVPSPAQFNHVISLVPTGGSYIWLDTTPEVAPYRLLLQPLRNKQALVIPSEQMPKLITTPENPPEPQRQEFSMSGKLDAHGTFTGHAELTYAGDTEVGLRAAFRNVPESQWKEFAQRFSR